MIFVYKYQVVDPSGLYRWEQKQFTSQKELFKYLVANKEFVLDQRKSIIKRAEGSLSLCLPVTEGENDFENKAIKPVFENDKEAGILKRTVVANTYWYMDSHSDVHIGRGDKGEEGTAIFTDAIKKNPSKIPPIDQHNYSLDGRMGKTLNLQEAPISWRALGLGKTGMTEALFADVQIEKAMNEKRYNDYLNNEIDQHSVGMRYIDVQLAVNDQEEYPKEYAVYQKYIGKIGNRSAVDAQGYFFAVEKADLREYSAVIAGSNDLTPTLSQGSGDPGKQESSGGDTAEILKALNKTIFLSKYYH